MISVQEILHLLPRYTDQWKMVKGQQTVQDIISLMLRQHNVFASDYDRFSYMFLGGSEKAIEYRLVEFCKKNIRYVEETESFQSVPSPAAILSLGQGDCKFYACFIGGVLDSLNRLYGYSFDWCYVFASYELGESDPYHVFIMVEDFAGREYLDPTPGADGTEPLYMLCEKPKRLQASAAVGRVSIGAAQGVLMSPPSWYPSYLPRFYNNGAGWYLYPQTPVKGFTENDVLDMLLYFQTLAGYNRTDYTNGVSAAVTWAGTKDQSVRDRVITALTVGDGGGNWAAIPTNGRGENGALYSQLQQRYIENEKTSRPWLSEMQAKGGGIDLLTIPMASDTEIERPTWYPKYLPSLVVTAGEPGQYPAGHLDTRPKIRNGKGNSGYTHYDITPNDVASLMLYAQPIVLAGPTPYPLLWYVNDVVNGTQAMYFKITLWPGQNFTDSQIQIWGVTGNILKMGDFESDPYAGGFTHTVDAIMQFAISFFAGKIPGGSLALKAAYTAGSIGGGEAITGGTGVPTGEFANQTYQAADQIVASLQKKKTTNVILFVALGLAAAGLIYYNQKKKDHASS